MSIKFVLSFLFCATVFLTNAQNTDNVRSAMKKAAEAGGYGIVAAQVEGSMVVVNTKSFTGLYEIDLYSNKLDTVFNSPLFQSTESKQTLIQLAQELTGKGVNYRKSGKYKVAAACYRFPLYAICNVKDNTGERIISNNLWILKEDLKYINEGPEILLIKNLLAGDAISLITKYEKEWLSELDQKERGYENTFLLYRRLLDFSNDWEKAEALVIRFSNILSQSNISENESFVTGVIEQLAQADFSSIATNLIGKPVNRFGALWKLYLDRSNYISVASIDFFRSKEEALLRQLCQLRLEALNKSATPLSQQFSYAISQYLQVPGRHVIYYYMEKGKPGEALAIAEILKARAFGDWLKRSHPSRLFKYKGYPYSNATSELDNIVLAADSADAPILTYIHNADVSYCWLIMPGGKMFYSEIFTDDSTFLRMSHFLGYSSQTDLVPGKAKLTNRGIKLGEESSSGDVDILKILWKQLLPDLFIQQINQSKSDKLIIIPDGVLYSVPFAALQDSVGKFLIEYKQISYWPSVFSWQILKDAELAFKLTSEKESLCIMGDAVYSNNYETTINGKREIITLDPLPGTAKEAKQIAILFNTSPLLQDQVNKAVLKGRRKYNILHFATHGYFNFEDPLRSFIALSDGSVFASDFYDENILLKSQLVVLSACQTGIGDLNLEVPTSLANSFLVGGANSVISSLWSVDDEATAALMIAFYKNIRQGKDISASLQAAQLGMLRSEKWKRPYFWAAFSLTGIQSNPLK